MTSSSPVVLIVVTYKSDTHLARLRSLIIEWLSLSTKHYCVVINNSVSDEMDNGFDMIVSGRFWYEQNSFNCGFSPAVNQAFEIARESLDAVNASLLLLNPDVTTTSRDLVSCYETGLADGWGVLGAVLRDEHGVLDRGVARRDWNLRRLLAEVAGMPWLTACMATPSRYIQLSRRQGRPTVADIVSGAFMWISSNVFRDGLDESLPMYLEDQEICIRARRLGRPVGVTADACGLHSGGDSRRALSTGAERIRMMELAEAPVRAWIIARGGSRRLAALTILGGACLRAVAAFIVALLVPSRRSWAREQFVLSKWFITWAAGVIVGCADETRWRMDGVS